MQECGEVRIKSEPSLSLGSNKTECIQRSQRILVVNETIETYLDTNSDSDPYELLIDESVKDEYIEENVGEYFMSDYKSIKKFEIKSAEEETPECDYPPELDKRFRKIAPKDMPPESVAVREVWRIDPPKKPAKKRKKFKETPKKQEVKPKITQNENSFPMEIESIDFTEDIVQMNYASDDESDLIPCPYCNFKNPKMNSIKKHLVMHHIGRTNCITCRFRTNSFKVMDTHMKKFHSKGIDCPFCEQSFEILRSMKKHILQTHRNFDVSKCFICGLQIKIQNSSEFMNQTKSLRKHVWDKHSIGAESVYNCPLCNFSTSLDLEIRSHIYMDHENSKTSIYKCLECPFLMNSLTSFLEHSDEHKRETPLQCNICKLKCSTAVRLDLHVKTHDKMLFQCRFCPFKCRYQFLMKYHIKSKHKKTLREVRF